MPEEKKGRVGAKLKRAPEKKTTLGDDIRAIAAHFGLRSREAEARHSGRTAQEIADEAAGAPRRTESESGRAEPSGQALGSGRVEHATNKAMSPSSPGGETITPEEREMIRAIARDVIKKGK